MLIWDQEGYNLRFSDKDGAMKSLTSSELKGLSMDNRNLYYLAQALSLGIDVGMIQKDYNVTPGSATDKMRLFGTDPNRVYRYESAKNIGAGAAKGFTVDTDPNVTNSRGDVGIKYIGGQRNPEMVLTSARKEDVENYKAIKKAKRDLQLDRNTEAYKETIARLGGKGTIEEVSR
jgi:hypothetical protein